PETTNSATVSASSVLSIEGITAFFNSMGASISNGIVQATEFIANKVTSKKIVTNGLEMTDSVTGDIYCVRISNGEWNKFKGTCGEFISEPMPVIEPAPVAPTPILEPAPTDIATTTPTATTTTTIETPIIDTATTTPQI
ncbi:MAG: hypothetical protein HZC14_02660, partial [Candidatus Niyogibacteria bacterium]|nr:hypothetical protein [Candidatus Niyogibacteria bacterium]